MIPPSPLSTLRLQSQPKLGPGAVEALIDQYSSPALLVDTQKKSVVLANAHLVELTAFSRTEMNGLGFEVLFPLTELKSLVYSPNAAERPIDARVATLCRRSGGPLDVHITATLLDGNERWALLTIEPLDLLEQRQMEQQRQGNLWKALAALASIPQQAESPEEALNLALQAGSELTGATLLAVYESESSDFILSRRAGFGPGELLPGQLHPHDLVSLKTAQIWTPKKRSQSSLHRAARASNLSFLASAPLGQPNALIGLLAIAGEQSYPPPETLDLLKILAATVTTILQNQSLSVNLQTNLQNQTREEAVFSAIKETVQDGIVVLSRDLTILELNPSAEAILGYTSREVRGQPYLNLLVGVENLVPAFISGQPGIVVHDLGNIKLYRRDGQSLLAHVRTLPIVLDSALERLIVVIEDLSREEQFRVKNQQLEQRALLGEVTAIFAHEVRNPINNLSTGLELTAMNLPPDHPNLEIITRLRQDCDRLAEQMRSVLSFSRPVEYRLAPVNLGISLKRLLERWHTRMMNLKIEYQLQVEPDAPPAEGDQRALEQVWNNLISNAIQAMGQEGGKLTVRVRPVVTLDNTLRVEVSVSDTGPGIPEEIRERIFEPFFTTKEQGTGLGLAITRQIIATHKGTIQLTSVPGGTVFQVQLPAAGRRQGEEGN